MMRATPWQRAMGEFAELSGPGKGPGSVAGPAAYAIDKSRLPAHLREAVVELAADEACVRFLEAAQDGALKELLCGATAALLHLCLTLPDLNAKLRRGEMWVISQAQARLLLGGPFQRLIDVGAGDGAVTAQLAPLAREVLTTEASGPMAARLRQRGLACLQTPLPAAGFTYDLVTCLNVLDRAERPLSLLRRLRELLTPSGVLLVGVVVPWRPAVLRRAGRGAPPSEALPAAVREAASFEQSAAALAAAVFEPLGFHVRRVSRVPYLSRGGARGVVALDDALFVLTRDGTKAVLPSSS